MSEHKDCNILNPLKRDGVSQRQRMLSALHPTYVSMDERELKDYLLYARRYAALLRYYTTNNNSDGDWVIFIEKDITTLASIIADTNLQKDKNRFNSAVKEILELPLAQRWEKLAGLFNQIYALASRTNQWYIQSIPDLKLNTELQKVIGAILSDALIDLRSIAERANQIPTITNAEPIVVPHESEYEDIWNLSGVVADVTIFPNGDPPSEEELADLLNRLRKVYKIVHDGMLSIVKKGDDFVEDTLTNYPRHAPHMTLFLAFLCILKIARDHLNTITRRHLNFYFRDVLGLNPNPAQPDQVHMIFELAKTFDNHRIEEDTQLKAQKDENGAKRIFTTDEDLIVNKTSIAESGLKSVFLDKAYDDDGNYVKLKNIYASPIANSLDGLGADIVEEDGKWLTFGDTTMPKAKVGFAVSSPVLLLKEGQRTITLTFHFDKENDLDWGEGNSSVNQVAHELKHNLLVYFTGEKEWIQVPIKEVQVNIKPGLSGTIVFTIELDSGIDSFLNYNEEVHLDGLSTKRPVLKLLLDNDGLSGDQFLPLDGELTIGYVKEEARPFDPEFQYQIGNLVSHENEWYQATVPIKGAYPSIDSVKWKHFEKCYAYSYFQQLDLTQMDIKVQVNEMKDLILENDIGSLNPVKPFQPFGPLPKLESKFYIGSHEVFQKALNCGVNDLKVNVEWADLPSSESFKQYYANYHSGGTVANDNEFKVKAEKLNNGVWTPAKNAQISLFNSNVTNGVSPTSASPYIFNNVHTERSHNLDTYTTLLPTAQRGFIRFVLKRDFSHKYFAPSVTQAVVNEPNPLTIPNQPYTPTISSISLSYCSEEKIKYNTRFKSDYEDRVEQLFHLEPFGWKEFFPIRNAASDKEVFVSRKLVPEFKVVKTNIEDNSTEITDAEGTLYIGLKDLMPEQIVTMLIQMSEGSADPMLETQPVTWSYLSYNEWKEFETRDILTEDTNGLLTSGIVKFVMSKLMNDDNTRLPDQTFWIKASVANDTKAISKTIAIMTQAVKATFDIQPENDLNRLNRSLEAETISKFVTRQASIKSVLQPYGSFNGKVAERVEAPIGVKGKDVLKKEYNEFYIRISERLRHKHRGITIWDYERMVLQTFPEIYKVKCINHTRQANENVCTTEHAPGHVKVIVLPNLRNKNAVDPLKPMVSKNTLEEITAYLKRHISDFVHLEVQNPDFEQIKVEFKVRFREEYNDKGFYTAKLQTDIVNFLSPWLTDEEEDLPVGGKIHRSSIINFIEETAYVDFLTDFKLYHITTNKDGSQHTTTVEEAIAKTSSSVIVSVPAEEHKIHHNIIINCMNE